MAISDDFTIAKNGNIRYTGSGSGPKYNLEDFQKFLMELWVGEETSFFNATIKPYKPSQKDGNKSFPEFL